MKKEQVQELLKDIGTVETYADDNEETNCFFVSYGGDWNDGDEIETSMCIDLDSLEYYIDDIKNETLCPTGAPDGAEFHTTWINDFYYIDKDGKKWIVILK